MASATELQDLPDGLLSQVAQGVDIRERCLSPLALATYNVWHTAAVLTCHNYLQAQPLGHCNECQREHCT